MTPEEAMARYPASLRRMEAAAHAMSEAMAEFVDIVQAMHPEEVEEVRRLVVPVIARLLGRLQAAMT